jgi:hypothetical protein
MGSFSIRHWIAVLLILAFPAIVVATEHGGERASHSEFAVCFLIAIILLCTPDVLCYIF